MKLHFIQNEATPHNNTLIKGLAARNDISLTLWYAREKSDKYEWKQNPTHEIQQAKIYGDHSVNWSLIAYLIRHWTDKVFQTGWGTPTTAMIVLVFFLLRRSYNLWFDFPQDACQRSYIKNQLRKLFYWMILHSKVNVFCVGKMTIDYFIQRGFPQNRLINLPIIVDISKSKSDYVQQRNAIRERYQVGENDLFFVAGSRLTKDKGYDLLIHAIALLPDKKRLRVKTLIIGQGEEEKRLLQQIKDAKLSDNVCITGWMDIEKYRAIIANADVFVHPARFDAYGGGTLNAMIVGTPVIGSYTAGSTVDRIKNGENGWLYSCDDIEKLKQIIAWCLDNRNKLPSFGKQARKTSTAWDSDKGVKIILRGLI